MNANPTLRGTRLKIRALVFDFDGLLLDTESSAYRSWCEVYREHGCELPFDRWIEYIGREGGWFDAAEYLEELVGRPLDREAVRARRRQMHTTAIAALDLAAGVRERVAEAKERGLRLAIATSSGATWVQPHLESRGFSDVWDAIVCREPPMRAKPEPDVYLEAVRRLGVPASEAVAFEDSSNGIRAAKAAGLWCVAIPNPLTARAPIDGADLRLDSLADMPLDAILAQLGAAT